MNNTPRNEKSSDDELLLSIMRDNRTVYEEKNRAVSFYRQIQFKHGRTKSTKTIIWGSLCLEIMDNDSSSFVESFKESIGIPINDTLKKIINAEFSGQIPKPKANELNSFVNGIKDVVGGSEISVPLYSALAVIFQIKDTAFYLFVIDNNTRYVLLLKDRQFASLKHKNSLKPIKFGDSFIMLDSRGFNLLKPNFL